MLHLHATFGEPYDSYCRSARRFTIASPAVFNPMGHLFFQIPSNPFHPTLDVIPSPPSPGRHSEGPFFPCRGFTSTGGAPLISPVRERWVTFSSNSSPVGAAPS